MPRPFAALVLLLLSLSPRALAQEVRFEKFTLENGMTVILHEDHTLPVVGINTWYYVGAKDEPPGRSGFAHLFEHLMFMGTQRVPGNQFDMLMEQGGGSNNASTSFDRTNYFSNGPSSLLPTLLWLDADRLEDLARTMTQEKLDLQREVVRNERRQSIENEPYGKAELRITEIMFPRGHPYHFEVIGTHADLEAAQVSDVKDFFANFYVPNNASLVVAGDFDSKQVKPLVESLFGTLPRQAEPAHTTVPPVALDRQVRATMLDQVQLPKVAFAYHSPPQFADGDAEMDLLAAVLTQGKSSRLYKRLVLQDKLAVEVSAYQSSAKLQSVFRIDILAQPGVELAAIEKAVDEEVTRLITKGLTAEELDQRKATIELSKLSQLQSVAAKADKLNEYQYYFGEPGSFKRDLDRYRIASVRSVQAWAKRVLTPSARLIMHVLPDQPQRTPSARDLRPQDSPPVSFSPDSPSTFELKNGMQVMLWPRPELPLVAVSVQFAPGGPLDAPSLAGRSALTAQMLGEGAGDLNAVEFADAIQSLGATFSADADHESAGVSLTVLKRTFPRAAALMADAIRRPRLEQSDWDRVKRLHLEELKQQDDQPTLVAGRVGTRLLFGNDHPYAWPTSGVAQTVIPLTLESVQAQHKELFRLDHATIMIAGDLTVEEARATLERAFGSWSRSPRTTRTQPAPMPIPSADAVRVVVVDRPGAVQTVIRFVTPAFPLTDDRRPHLRLLNELLGGGFTSRLNQNLREKNGYTYGARSAFVMEPSTGYFIASSSVRADVTGPALQEFLSEFRRLRDGDVTDAEIGKARESQRTETVQSFAGVRGVLGQAGQLAAAGLRFEVIAADMDAMHRATASDINKLARPSIALEQGVIVLVGDKALILEQIKDLGLPAVVEYDIYGEPVK